MYDALPAGETERGSLPRRAGHRARPAPRAARNALRRYAAMDKTWAGFNKDWGYMGCVKAAAPTEPAPQPQRRRDDAAAARRAAPRRDHAAAGPVSSTRRRVGRGLGRGVAREDQGAATADEIAALEALARPAARGARRGVPARCPGLPRDDDRARARGARD